MFLREKSKSAHTIAVVARLARVIAIGVPHHITQRGTASQRVFYTDADREVYLSLLEISAPQARLRILAFCLMTNHVHLVAVPEEGTSMAVALRRTHGRYASYLNTRRGRTGHLWQNRFYSCALDAQHARVALRYVERNPVRAGLVDLPADYRWSSASAHLAGADPRGLLDMGFWDEQGGREGWQTLLATPEELLEIRTLQRGTFTGRPVGSGEFVEDLEQQTHRQLRPHQGVRLLQAAG
jgi:putative transposase